MRKKNVTHIQTVLTELILGILKLHWLKTSQTMDKQTIICTKIDV